MTKYKVETKMKIIGLALAVFAVVFGIYSYKMYRFVQRHPMVWGKY